MSSWKENAGRQGGPEEYEFGDYSRSVLKWLKKNDDDTAANQSNTAEQIQQNENTWRALSGRTDGPDGYKFGDLTSTTINFLFGGLLASPKKATIQNEPSMDSLSREEKLALVRRKAEEHKKRMKEEERKKMRDAKVLELQNKFRDAAVAVVGGKAISPEQLDVLWDVSKELTAEQAAEVLAPLLQQMSKNAATTTSDPVAKVSLGVIIDTVLSGQDITQEQISLISTYAARLTDEDLMAVVTQSLMNSWARKAAAKKAREDELAKLKEEFSDSVKKYLESAQGHGDHEGFLMIVSASQFLPQKVVALILEDHNTSWEALNKLQSVKKQAESHEFVAAATQRGPKSPGWKPPPPPPRAKLAPPPPPPPPAKAASTTGAENTTTSVMTTNTKPPPPTAPTAPVTATAAAAAAPSTGNSAAEAVTVTVPTTNAHESSASQQNVKLPERLLIDLLKEKRLKKVDSNPSLKDTAGGSSEGSTTTLKPKYQQALEHRINAMRLHIAPIQAEEDESDDENEWK